jgi:uncharacterized membrane protein
MNQPTKENTMEHDDIERLARKRADAKMGWYIHAGVYIAVNLLLAAIATASGRAWFVFPALGWGLGLAIHGVAVFLVAGGGLHEKLVARERERLALQRDPW